MAASLTENQPYHNAMTDGEAPKYLIRGTYRVGANRAGTAFASPQGQAAAGDLANFADGGAELYFFDTKDV